jgi:hypothetical protein
MPLTDSNSKRQAVADEVSLRRCRKEAAHRTYPQVGLRDARKKRDGARDLIAQGKDPALEKQREKLRAGAVAENTFTSIASEYCRKRRGDGDKAWAPAAAALGICAQSAGQLDWQDADP